MGCGSIVLRPKDGFVPMVIYVVESLASAAFPFVPFSLPSPSFVHALASVLDHTMNMPGNFPHKGKGKRGSQALPLLPGR